MKRKEFNEEEIKRIEENPNVTSTTRKAITFHPDFKLEPLRSTSGERIRGRSFKTIEDEKDKYLDKPKKIILQWKSA
ncbi:hypothetical protein [Aneurinibacillus migulanus]|uniref:hypothetical protein n=1 Tax=Aneurinibacillus migulanus TaxID=47500 RepID=UPI00209D42F0|nr:hypothetical protein [Aneurinibacillus migulanus]MCP1359353.1 hypothetical protein [Aneurinibacillus migulanus]